MNRIPLLCLISGLLALTAGAQTGPALLSALQARQQAYLNSKPYFAVGDLVNGEKTLESANMQKAGTPEWNLESAGLLERMAFDFQGRGYGALVGPIAQLALAQLGLSEQKFTSADPASEISNEKQLAGTIYECLIGDRVSAKQYYTLAVQIWPKNSSAVASLARFAKSDAEEASKVATTGQ